MRRFAITSVVVLATIALSGILIRPARAFTLLTANAIVFDPVSVAPGEILYVHIFNTSVNGTLTYQPIARRNNGNSFPFGGGVGLTAGFGADDFVPYSQLQSNGLNTTVVVAVLFGVPPITTLPADWPARIAASVEVIDDKTYRTTAIMAHRHVILAPVGPCVFCP